MAQVIDPKNIGVQGLRGLKFDPDRAQSKGLDYAKQLNISSTKASPAISNVGILGAGDSRLDTKRELNLEEYSNLENFRGEEQSGFWQVANGITKGGILAGTTFLQGTLGLVDGVASAILERDKSKFWDNDFNRALKDLNEWSERVFPNYYTDDERDNPLTTRNIFSWNSLGDKLIKNLGFTVGAFYSGNILSKPLSAISAIKATGALPHVASGLGATLSAVNEGSIEALNNSQDWFNLQKSKLDDTLSSELKNLEFYKNTSNYQSLYDSVIQKYNNEIGNLEERRTKMGNADLLMNLPILMASNLVEFGKLYARGFDTARKASGKIARDEAGQYLRREATRLGRIGAGVKAATAEGLEEVMQQAASNISGELQMPSREYNLSMHGASINPDAEEETVDTIKAIATGLNRTLNDDSTWEQFIIGALTGALGMPTFGRANNANAYLGKNKVIGLSGGAVGAIRDYNQQIETDNEIVDALNNRVQSPEFRNYYQGMLRHQYFQDSMDAAAAEGKTKEFKDAEYAQMVSDVALFAKAGKLDDYVALINESADTSDENLESIIRNTTKEDGTGPFIDSNGNLLTFTEEGKQQMKDGILARKQEMLNAVNDYKNINESLVARFGDALTQDQREELVWLSMLSKNQMNRAIEISEDSKQTIGDLVKLYQADIDDYTYQKEYYGISKSDDKKLENAKRIVSYLNSLQSLSGLSMAISLTANSSIIENAIKNKDRMIDIVNPIDADRIKKLADIPELVRDSQKYAQKLDEYLNNPQKLEQDQQKETKKAEEQIKSKEEKKQTRQLNNSKDFNDVRKTLTESQGPNRETVEKSIKESTNPVVQEYKELRDKVNSVRERMYKNGSDAQAREDANILLDRLISTAQSGTDLDTSSEIFIDSDNLPDIDGETPDQKQGRLKKAAKLIDDSLADISANPPLNPAIDTDEEGNLVETYGENLVPGFDDDLEPINQNTNQQVVDNGSVIVNNLGDGSMSYSVNPSSFESTSDNSQSQEKDMKLADQEERPEDITELSTINPSTKWHPAVSQYDLNGMKHGVFVGNSNEEWKRVNAYITKGDGYNFVNDGRFARAMSNNGKLYFGIDSTFDGDNNTIFIYVKDGDSYIPVGSMFLNKTIDENGQEHIGGAVKFVGMEDFNNSIYDEYNSLETKPDGIWISSKLGKVDKLYHGRVNWLTEPHNVSEALVGSEITTPNIVVFTTSGVKGASDNTIFIPEKEKSYSEKIGQAYIEVPNAKRGFKGGKSLVFVNPISINEDILKAQNPIINSINIGINNIAEGFKSRNNQIISDGIRILAENLLIQNVEFSTNGNILHVNKISIKNGRPETVTKNGKIFNKIEKREDIILDSNTSDAIAERIKDFLISIDCHIRINKDRLSPEYSKQLIDNNLVQTYATTLKSEAAWFEFSPYVESTEQKVEETKKEEPAKNPEEARKESLSKKASIFNMGRQGTAVKVKPSEKKSSQPVVKPEQSARDAVKALLTDTNRFMLLNKGFSDSWINSPDRTVEEIQNALGCD